jgi:hypothetical protein
MPEAALGVIVDDPDGLHPRVDDGGTDELEAALLERPRDLLGERRLRGNGTAVLKRLFAREAPHERREILAGILHREIGARAADRRFDLRARAHDAGVVEQAHDVALAEVRDLLRIEAPFDVVVVAHERIAFGPGTAIHGLVPSR